MAEVRKSKTLGAICDALVCKNPFLSPQLHHQFQAEPPANLAFTKCVSV
jgi:hypothetical protein